MGFQTKGHSYLATEEIKSSDLQSQPLVTDLSEAHPTAKSSKITRTRQLVGNYADAFSSFTAKGRQQVYRTIKSSGPAYEPQRQDDDNQGDPKTSYAGWRKGVLLSAVVFGASLVAELAMLVAAYQLGQKSNAIYTGSCAKVRNIVIVLAIPVNLIGTLITAASNYVMQCVSSPSRSELDRAHSCGKSLSIGALTLSNTLYIRKRKRVSWWVMGASSLLVHLLLNATFFATLQSNEYGVLVVTQDYQDPAKWTNCGNSNFNFNGTFFGNMCELYYEQTPGNSSIWSYQEMGTTDCVNAYANGLDNSHFNLVAVADSNWTASQNQALRENFPAALGYFRASQPVSGTFTNDTGPSPAYEKWDSMTVSNEWLCAIDNAGPCRTSDVIRNITNHVGWRITPDNILIDHCYSMTIQEQCTVEYSLIVLIIVISCTVVKLAISLYMLRAFTEAPCTTIGDAISSYLRSPDPLTTGMCLVSQEQVRNSKRISTNNSQFERSYPLRFSSKVIMPRQEAWEKNKHARRWIQVPSRLRWLCFAVVFSLVLVPWIYIFSGGLRLNVAAYGGDWWRGGLLNWDLASIYFNDVFETDVDDTSSINFFATVLAVNTPQVAISILYYLFNSIFSAMHAAKEWSDYSTERKSLRVSSPSRGQRSTYWLSLPWSYSIPLVAVSALVHWLVSRSLYSVRLFQLEDQFSEGSVFTNLSAVGFSPLAMLSVLALLVIMLLVLIGFGMRKLDADMPLVGTSSIAISAACHSLADRPWDEPYEPLLWGVVREQARDGTPGHCTFSSGNVTKPIEGHVYA